MNKNHKTGLIIMLAVISGYVSMGFMITVVQEWIFGGVSSVSYTHLDVYKRQVLN